MAPVTSEARTIRPEVEAAQRAATELRATLGLDPAAPLDCIVELAERRLGIDVVVAPLAAHVSGFYLPVAPRPLVVVSGEHAVSRQRFTVAHEVGHHVLGHGAAPRIQALDAVVPAAGVGAAAGGSAAAGPGATTGGPAAGAGDAVIPAAVAAHYETRRSVDPKERAANTFAAELLAPTAGVIECAARWASDAPLDRVVRISAHFGMSALAVLFRLQVLGLIDSPTKEAVHDDLRAQRHLPRYDALGLRPLDDELERHQASGALCRANPAARMIVRRLMAELSATA